MHTIPYVSILMGYDDVTDWSPSDQRVTMWSPFKCVVTTVTMFGNQVVTVLSQGSVSCQAHTERIVHLTCSHMHIHVRWPCITACTSVQWRAHSHTHSASRRSKSNVHA